jgi:hypothetical protein
MGTGEATRQRIGAPNTYQASVVKRADGCIAGAGWPSVEQTVNRYRQVFAADLISVAGHSLSCTKHLLRVNVSVDNVPRETVALASTTPEKLFCALIPVLSK